jgi:hypothetical protein
MLAVGPDSTRSGLRLLDVTAEDTVFIDGAAGGVGALNLYSTEPRAWSDEDIALAALLADVANSHLVNASRLRLQAQLTEQLQEGMESRIVVEQAKEITADQNGITVEQAYQRMRRHARSNHTSLRVVFEAIVAVGLKV